MSKDPVVEEARKIREELAAKHNNDIREIPAAARKREQKSGRPVVSSARRRGRRSLDDLLRDVTPENLHGEIDWGEPRGREVW
jgi:antitoxin MazE